MKDLDNKPDRLALFMFGVAFGCVVDLLVFILATGGI